MMTNDEKIAKVAVEIMGWELKPAVAPEFMKDDPIYFYWKGWKGSHLAPQWNPLARWDHAGMVFDKLIADGYNIETDTDKGFCDKGFCDILLSHADPDKVVRVILDEPAFPAAIVEAALATLEEGE